MIELSNMKKLEAPEKRQQKREPKAYVNKWGTIMINKEAVESFVGRVIDVSDIASPPEEAGFNVYIKSFEGGIKIVIFAHEHGAFNIKPSAKTGRGSIYVGKENMAGIYDLPKQRPKTVVHENGLEIIYKR